MCECVHVQASAKHPKCNGLCVPGAGENLSLKWLVLSELQGCSLKMVEVRSRSGSVHDAKLLLLEALEMSAKLQAVSQYVGLDSRTKAV